MLQCRTKQNKNRVSSTAACRTELNKTQERRRTGRKIPPHTRVRQQNGNIETRQTSAKHYNRAA